jgi:hypothetical protein
MLSHSKSLVLAVLAALTLAACGGQDHDVGATSQAQGGAGGGGGTGGGGFKLPPPPSPTPLPNVTFKANLVASASAPSATGSIVYKNAGGKVVLTATLSASEFPVGTSVCEYVNGVPWACGVLADVAGKGVPPFSTTITVKTLTGAGLDLAHGAVVELQLGVDAGGLAAGTAVAGAVL